MKNFLIKLLGGYTKTEIAYAIEKGKEGQNVLGMYEDSWRGKPKTFYDDYIDRKYFKQETPEDNLITFKYECTEENPCEYHPSRGTGTSSTSTVPGNKRIEIYSDTEQYFHKKLEPKKQKQKNGTKKRTPRPSNTKK